MDPLKFDSRGRALPYYGNTIISFTKGDPINDFAFYAQNTLRQTGFAEKLAFLPASSFHMTVLTLLRERDRGTAVWPAGIPADARFPAIDKALKACYDRVMEAFSFDGVTARLTGVRSTSLRLEPADARSKAVLLGFRDAMAEASGIRHQTHETFGFHITLDYDFAPFTADEQAEIAAVCGKLAKEGEGLVFHVPAPDFVIFNDMLAYHTDLSRRGPLY